MALVFYKLPVDILLEVVKFLQLPDPLSLLLTCSLLFGLSTERSFWISVLENTRERYPISCPIYADLSQYDLDALMRLVVSWLKLQNNWNQPSPHVAQLVTSTRLPGFAYIIFNVQGTDILVLTTIEGSVFCWDTKLAAPFPLPHIETGGPVTRVSGRTEAPGTCSFAILAAQATVPLTAHRYVITLKHEKGKVVSFTGQSSSVFIPSDREFESLFLTEDMVGTIVAMEDQEECVLTVGSVSGNRLVDSTSVLKLRRSPSNYWDLAVSFTYRGHLYTVLDDAVQARIHHVSRKALQSGHCEQSGLYSSKVFASHHANAEPFCCMIPSTSYYGVSAVFVHLEWDDPGLVITSFSFLPNTLTHAPDDGVSSPLTFDSPFVRVHVHGQLTDMNLVWLDHSGFNVIAAIPLFSDTESGFNPALSLVLVRYRPETRSSSTHTLAVPNTINLHNIDSVCVDDSAGAVHLVDAEGILSTLRYV